MASADTGNYNPVSGPGSTPDAFEGTDNVILTADRQFLFATSGSGNSVCDAPSLWYASRRKGEQSSGWHSSGWHSK